MLTRSGKASGCSLQIEEAIFRLADTADQARYTVSMFRVASLLPEIVV